jgi:hypothetical protein
VIQKAKARELKTKRSPPKGSTPVRTYPLVNSRRDSPKPVQDDLSAAVQQDHRFPSFWASAVATRTYLSPVFYNNIGPALEERATNFFVSNYVTGVKGHTRGYLDVIENTYDFDANLIASIKAAGLAGFANIENSAAVMKEARKRYLEALKLTNLALQSSTEAKKDSTLLSIMILSMYETISGTNQTSLKHWAEHIRGAAALVKLRGLEQLLTPKGRRLVIQVTSNLLIVCIQWEMALPDHILELREHVRNMVDSTQPAWRIQDLMVEFCAFRTEAKDGLIQDPRYILSRALEIDGQLLTIFTNPPLGWRYERRYTELDHPDNVWNGCYHVYHDYGVTQMWNSVRTCQMMLHKTIRDALLEGFSTHPPLFSRIEHTAQFQLSTDVLYQLQADILASVPQYIGFGPQNASLTGRGTPSASSPPSEIPHKGIPVQAVLRASGGYFLMRPLFFAASIDVASEESRRWIIGRLRYIGWTMGIRQAIVLAAAVENRIPIRACMSDQKDALDTRQGPNIDPQEVELDGVSQKKYSD